MKRVGHGGTLDPFASGVLIVAAGRATRILQYIQDSDKRYLAHFVLGAETDTLDVDGKLTSRHDRSDWPSLQDVELSASTFVGTIDQVPPAYSAIKISGRKLYELARSGVVTDVPSRSVTIHAIDIIEYDPPDVFAAIHCGKGTYVRSLARDIGAHLGTGAYCHALRRLTNGPYCLADCWSLDELASNDIRERWPAFALHPDTAVPHLDAVVVAELDATAWYHGRSIRLTVSHPLQNGHLVRVYSVGGRFLGIGQAVEQDVVRPKFVMPANEEDESE